MIIGGFGVGNVTFRNPFAEPPVSERPLSDSALRLIDLDAERLLARIGRTVDRLDRLDPSRSLGSNAKGPATAISSAPIGLTTVATRATLTSSVEINETATSFTPNDPTWIGLSTAAVSIAGFYDGNQGTDSLRFEVADGGEIGIDAVRISIRDGEGALIEVVLIPARAAPETTYELDSGLLLSLGPGLLVAGDGFDLDVADNDPQEVDPTAAFDGSDGHSVNFGSGSVVTEGSFVINGKTISVAADDTIIDVLDRITADTDIVATFDHPGDRVVLSHKIAGAGHDITLEGDTSGFVAAVKLDGALLSAGADSQSGDRVIASLDPLGSVVSGTLQINEAPVAVDAAADTLTAILDRVATLDQIDAGYSASTDRVRISSASGPLRLDDDRTGILSAVNLESKTYSARSGRGGLTRRQANRVVDEVDQLVHEVNELDRLLSENKGVRTGIHAALRSTLSTFAEGGALGSLGLEFGTVDSSDGQATTAQVGGEGALRIRSSSTLVRSLRNDPLKAYEALFGTKDDSGLLGSLDRLGA